MSPVRPRPSTRASSESLRSGPTPASTAMTWIVSAIKARGTGRRLPDQLLIRRAHQAPSPHGWCRPRRDGRCPQAFKRSSASAPLTSPIGNAIRRKRRTSAQDRRAKATPSLVRSATRIGACIAALLYSSITRRDRGLCHLRQQRISERGLAGRKLRRRQGCCSDHDGPAHNSRPDEHS